MLRKDILCVKAQAHPADEMADVWQYEIEITDPSGFPASLERLLGAYKRGARAYYLCNEDDACSKLAARFAEVVVMQLTGKASCGNWVDAYLQTPKGREYTGREHLRDNFLWSPYARESLMWMAALDDAEMFDETVNSVGSLKPVSRDSHRHGKTFEDESWYEGEHTCYDQLLAGLRFVRDSSCVAFYEPLVNVRSVRAKSFARFVIASHNGEKDAMTKAFKSRFKRWLKSEADLDWMLCPDCAIFAYVARRLELDWSVPDECQQHLPQLKKL